MTPAVIPNPSTGILKAESKLRSSNFPNLKTSQPSTPRIPESGNRGCCKKLIQKITIGANSPTNKKSIILKRCEINRKLSHSHPKLFIRIFTFILKTD